MKTCEFANIISIFFLLTRIQKCPSHQFRKMPHILSKHPFLRYISGWFTGAVLTFRNFIISIFIHLVPRRPYMKLVIHVFLFLYSQMDFGFNIFQEPFPGIFDQFFVVGSKSNVDVGFIIKFRSLCWK